MSEIITYKEIKGTTFVILKDTLFSNWEFMKYGDGFIISKGYKHKRSCLNKYNREIIK